MSNTEFRHVYDDEICTENEDREGVCPQGHRVVECWVDDRDDSVDLMSALEKLMGRTLPDEPFRLVLDDGPDEPPEPDHDVEYEADQAADRYEREIDSRW